MYWNLYASLLQRIQWCVSASLTAEPPVINASGAYLSIRNLSPQLSGQLVLNASTGGAPETPSWFLYAGPNTELTIPPSGNSITVKAQPGATPGCSAEYVQYQVGNLKSNFVPVIVVGVTQYNSSREDDVWNYSSLSGTRFVPFVGYKSLIEWTVTDTCGHPVDGVQFHEEFPNGFQFQYAGSVGWNFPTADQWCLAGSQWTDTVGQSCQALIQIGRTPHTLCTPDTLNPLTPLGTTAIYSGTQTIWAGYLSSSPTSCVNSPTFLGSPNYDANNDFNVWTGTQVHYQDHGDFRQP